MWAVLHEIRSEYAQLMTSAFLLFASPGPASLDAVLRRRPVAPAAAPSDRRRVVTPAEGTYGAPARW
jgi:putative oxidoreductase